MGGEPFSARMIWFSTVQPWPLGRPFCVTALDLSLATETEICPACRRPYALNFPPRVSPACPRKNKRPNAWSDPHHNALVLLG